MKTRQTLLAAAFGVLLSGSVWANPMSAADAEALLLTRGFNNIAALEYENGMWLATATDRDGQRVNVTVNPVGEEVTSTVTTTTTTVESAPVQVVEKPVVVERVVERPVVIQQPAARVPIVVREQVIVPAGGKIDKTDVRMVLTGAGYHDIHDIDWLSGRGVWKAEARDPYGDDREIHVDPIDGRIVHVEDD